MFPIILQYDFNNYQFNNSYLSFLVYNFCYLSESNFFYAQNVSNNYIINFNFICVYITYIVFIDDHVVCTHS